MSKTATPQTMTLGKYAVTVEGKQSRLPVTKKIYLPTGKIEERTFFVPMEQTTVVLRHEKGGYVIYRKTAMGKKLSFSRSIGLPGEKVITKEATGPEYVLRGDKPLSMKAEHVAATISRMCGISMKEALELFTVTYEEEAA